jgi:O-antigen/teichoic acid export membrane protein
MSNVELDRPVDLAFFAPEVRAFVRDVTATAMTRVVGIATGIVTLTMTTRLLGAEGRGEFAVAMATLGLVLQFCNFGLHSSATYHLSRNPALRREVTGFLASYAIVVVGVVSLIVAAAVHSWPQLIPHVPPRIVSAALATAPAAMFVLLAGSAWLGLGRAAHYNALDLGTKFIGLGSVLLLLWWPLSGFFTAYAALHCVLAVLAYQSLVGWTRPILRTRVVGDLMGYGFRAFLVNLCMFLIVRQDLFLVNAWRGSSEAGQYSVAVQVSDLLSLAAASITAVLFPRLASMPPDRRWAVTWRAVRWTAAAIGTATIALAAVGQPIFRIAFGTPFLASVVPFWLLLPGLWCLAINSVLLQHLGASGMPWFVILSTASGVFVNLMLNVWLIPRNGIAGAAAASSATYAALLVATTIYLLGRRPSRASS